MLDFHGTSDIAEQALASILSPRRSSSRRIGDPRTAVADGWRLQAAAPVLVTGQLERPARVGIVTARQVSDDR